MANQQGLISWMDYSLMSQVTIFPSLSQSITFIDHYTISIIMPTLKHLSRQKSPIINTLRKENAYVAAVGYFIINLLRIKQGAKNWRVFRLYAYKKTFKKYLFQPELKAILYSQWSNFLQLTSDHSKHLRPIAVFSEIRNSKQLTIKSLIPAKECLIWNSNS